MKRILGKPVYVICALIVLAAALGFGAVKTLKAHPDVRPPHSAVYKLTTYDENGNVIFRSTSFRRVMADGSWQETQILSDGQVKHMHGQLRGVITNRTATSDMPEHLGIKYFEENTRTNQSWVSPELQDLLRYVSLRDDGSIHWTLEAVEVNRP